ncbi:phosphatidylinositol N-acetylglucosaminyltransferase subunit A-like isoform X2 [Brassica rapa]|uniref:phosphatidylinositol N-acetylglucosaminyltransferase subunit A-like isoform X2 n=1 Tax=Brassica campestris TaxID=3711 RepID=UPI00142E539C|nr:phosphatidylinositol N-acetylglucosaminyltransferase subunit A-like isoform X2 [Brassica rapa]
MQFLILVCALFWSPVIYSLTEAFCTAILEAASCGLLTVSTRVGCVPEVLPDDMVVLAEPDPEDDMVRAIGKAISILPSINPEEMHNRMKKLYSWQDVAKRAEIVYDRAFKCSNRSLLERLSRFLSCGACAGKVFCMVMIIDYLLWRLLQLLQVRIYILSLRNKLNISKICNDNLIM